MTLRDRAPASVDFIPHHPTERRNEVDTGIRVSTFSESESGDTTPCRMTGVTLHSHVRYTENRGPRDIGPHVTGLYPQSEGSLMTSFSAATLREEQKGLEVANTKKGGKPPVEVANFNPSSGLQACPSPSLYYSQA